MARRFAKGLLGVPKRFGILPLMPYPSLAIKRAMNELKGFLQRLQAGSFGRLGGVPDEAVIDSGYLDVLHRYPYGFQQRVKLARLLDRNRAILGAVDQQRRWAVTAHVVSRAGSCQQGGRTTGQIRIPITKGALGWRIDPQR